MSNQQVAYFLERKLREIFSDFAKKLMIDCGYPEALGSIPVHFETPIYSSFDTEFKEYAAPGVVMTLVFYVAVYRFLQNNFQIILI